MTNTTPTDPSATDIIPPPEVQAVLDEAYANNHDIVLGQSSAIRIVDKQGALVTEVAWPQAGEWSRRVWRGVVAGSPRITEGDVAQ